jgi:hypothetical protein
MNQLYIFNFIMAISMLGCANSPIPFEGAKDNGERDDINTEMNVGTETATDENSSDSIGHSNADADSDTDTDSDVDTDTDTDIDTDTDGDTDTDADTDSDTDTDSDAEIDTDSEGNGNTDSKGELDSDTYTESDTENVRTEKALKTSDDIVIDGVLNETEWASITPIENVVVGTPNDTVYFDVLWNDSFLYIGVTSNDESLCNNSDAPWDDDAVKIFIDGDHNHSYNNQASDAHCIFAYNDEAVYCQSEGYNPVFIDNYYASRPKETAGFDMEIAIPWEYLNILPVAGMVIGWDISIDDDDAVDDADSGDDDSDRDSLVRWNGTVEEWWQMGACGHVELLSHD